MGAATDQASAAVVAALDGARDVDLDVAGELFAAARAIGESLQLSGALSDSAAPPDARAAVVTAVFGPVVKPTTARLLVAVTRARWSGATDLVEGIEELAVRAAAIAAPDDDVEGELFSVSRTIARHPDLELALGRNLGDARAKGTLVDSLWEGRASAATTLIVSSIVQLPTARRVRQRLARAMRLVADQRSRTVATVTVAAPLSDAQLRRLAAALGVRYGADVSLNTVVDPSVVGGLKVQIGDDVIDASVSSRLADLRQRLAG